MTTNDVKSIVERRTAERASLIAAAYAEADGSVSEFVQFKPLLIRQGISVDNWQSLLFWLEQKDLIQNVSPHPQGGVLFQLTTKATDVVEQLTSMDNPPPVNVLGNPVVNGNNNVTIVTGHAATVSVQPPVERWWQALTEVAKKFLIQILSN